MKNAETEAYWQAYLAALPAGATHPQNYLTTYFGSSLAVAQELADLILGGTKTATAGLLWTYADEEGWMPQPGDLTIMTTFDGHPLGIFETTYITVRPFREVDAEHAYLEGEDDRSLAMWREVHWRIFEKECAELGRTADEDIPVVCERFRLVFPVRG